MIFSFLGKFRAGDGRLAGWPGSWPGWLGWQAGWLELAAHNHAYFYNHKVLGPWAQGPTLMYNHDCF